MPRKVRQLIADLKKAGFVDRGGKGSHRNFIHSSGAKCTISDKEGGDALRYQEKAVKEAINTSKNEKDRN